MAGVFNIDFYKTFGDLHLSAFGRSQAGIHLAGSSAKNEFSERNIPAAKSTTTELTASNMQCFSTGIFSSHINYLTWESIVSVAALLTHPTY